MAVEINKTFFKPYESKMHKSIEFMQDELNTVRAGRANPHVLDRITVSYYGADTPLNQVANIQVPEPRMLTVTPWDPSLLKEIEKSIQASDLGINPNNDGKMLRLVFPAPTEERRRDLVKQIQRIGEDAKIAIRNIRRECIDELKGHQKRKEISDDVLRDAEGETQKMTDRFIAKVDESIADKEKDLMEF